MDGVGVIIIGLLTLTAMEIVLGIDNIIFISIVSSKLPESQQPLARRLGLLLALVSRLALLFVLKFIVDHLQFPIFHLTDLGIPENLIERFAGLAGNVGTHGAESVHHSAIDAHHASTAIARDSDLFRARFAESNGISWKDVILGVGGVFLIGKSVYEIHDQFNHSDHEVEPSRSGLAAVLVQIAILDIIFSLDSIITAVGMVESIWVMCAAIVVAVIVMLIFSEPVSRFVTTHPTLKMLALSFLILIGVMLVAESIGAHLDKGYIYFAMVFALIVEFLNLRLRSKRAR